VKPRVLSISLVLLAVALVALGTVGSERLVRASTPQGAVEQLYAHVRNRDYKGAYSYVAPASKVDLASFTRDLTGKDGSLRTYSSLAEINARVLNESENEATVRANLQWSTAVGAFYDTRDLKVVKAAGEWRVLWPLEKAPNLPPQVIPVNYLRWDIIRRGAEDDWGAQNAEAPRVRIISMNALEKDGGTIILGEIVNEDTVPGFVSVNATLLGQQGNTVGEESSFDKISHVLLPKEVSPFRIDFPGIKLATVKNVRMQPTALLVPASADPVMGVLHQRLDKVRGHNVLEGELMNESGLTVNIPHVLATFYDDSGKVIWVSDAYLDRALLPQVPLPFVVPVRDDVAPKIHSYRVTVNQYSMDRPT
jgi:hypothetical protein